MRHTELLYSKHWGELPTSPRCWKLCRLVGSRNPLLNHFLSSWWYLAKEGEVTLSCPYQGKRWIFQCGVDLGLVQDLSGYVGGKCWREGKCFLRAKCLACIRYFFLVFRGLWNHFPYLGKTMLGFLSFVFDFVPPLCEDNLSRYYFFFIVFFPSVISPLLHNYRG